MKLNDNNQQNEQIIGHANQKCRNSLSFSNRNLILSIFYCCWLLVAPLSFLTFDGHQEIWTFFNMINFFHMHFFHTFWLTNMFMVDSYLINIALFLFCDCHFKCCKRIPFEKELIWTIFLCWLQDRVVCLDAHRYEWNYFSFFCFSEFKECCLVAYCCAMLPHLAKINFENKPNEIIAKFWAINTASRSYFRQKF